MNKLEQALEIVKHNLTMRRYVALPKEKSNLVRKYYKQFLLVPDCGLSWMSIHNECNTIIANGYNDIVIGDYGAYFEIKPDQLRTKLVNRFPDDPSRMVFYIWMQTNDQCQTKVYYQLASVDYAPYEPGYYYVSVRNTMVSGQYADARDMTNQYSYREDITGA